MAAFALFTGFFKEVHKKRSPFCLIYEFDKAQERK
jgi:hypothetical protein